MNDPNGPVYWKGQYHLFYQYNPGGAFWGDMHWGHAVSADMVHWKHLPIALSPTPGGPDADGCFTGTAVIQDSRVVIVYTGVRSVSGNEATSRGGGLNLRESQCMAHSDDPELNSWTKVSEPVIAVPPSGIVIAGFRDPSPFRHGDEWLMVVGSGVPHRQGMVLLYRSKDLYRWEYLHPLIASGSSETVGNPAEADEMWECPDFFALGNKHVLIYSSQGKSHWKTGELDAKTLTFHPEQTGILDTGSFYAAKTQIDKSGNRVLWGWIPETRPLAEYRAAGWAGLMSLPRILTMGDDGRLRMQVAPEVGRLRRQEQSILTKNSEELRIKQISEMTIEDGTAEIACTLRPGPQRFELWVSLEGEQRMSSEACVSIRFDPTNSGEIMIANQAIPIGKTAAIDINIFLDSSVAETIVNSSAAHTSRFYYSGNRPRNLRLNWTGSIQSLERVSVWQISPISPNRMT